MPNLQLSTESSQHQRMPDWNEVSDLPFEEQVPIYKSHLAEYPSDAAIWFDLGLAHKYLLQWLDAVDPLDVPAFEGDPPPQFWRQVELHGVW